MRRSITLVGCIFALAALELAAVRHGDAATRPVRDPRRLAVVDRGDVPVRPTACAWPFIVDDETLNLAYPDPNSTYWAMPFDVADGSSLRIEGTFPSSRFMAVTLYDLEGDIVTQLSDFQISPQPGSANPFAVADPPPGSGRAFRVDVVAADAVPAATNVLQLPEGQDAGWLVYRIYLGNGDRTGGVALPTIARERDGAVVRSLAPCATFLPGTVIGNLVARTMPDPLLVTAPPAFVRIANDGGLFVNAANAYLTAFADHAPGKILVVRGQLPATPDTGAGQSVVGDFDLRYLSITSNLNQKPYPTVDGLYDSELELDDAGYYTVVVARDADVPANAAAEGAQVLEWGDGDSQAVIVRNMLPYEGFDASVQDVTPSNYGAPTDAPGVMGTFYPVIVECSRALFELSGAQGCFAAAGEPYPGG